MVLVLAAPTMALGGAGAEDPLSGWSRASRITVFGHDAGGTDVPVLLEFDSAARIAAGTMRRDCADVRIADAEGRVLPHWLLSGCGQRTTRVWFLAPRVGPGSLDAYDLHHGNPSAASVSDASPFLTSTTTFAEGWDDGDTVGWSTTLTQHRSSGTTTGREGTPLARYLRHEIPEGNWGNNAVLAHPFSGATPTHLRLHHRFDLSSGHDYAGHRAHFVFDEEGTRKDLYVYLARYGLPVTERPSSTTLNVLAHERPAGAWNVLDVDLRPHLKTLGAQSLTSFSIEMFGRSAGGSAWAQGTTDSIALSLWSAPMPRARAIVQADSLPREAVSGAMAIRDPPPCAPSCGAGTYGYTSSALPESGGTVRFDVDLGAMAGHPHRVCATGVCTRWLDLDLVVQGSPRLDLLADGQRVDIARVEQWTPFGWRSLQVIRGVLDEGAGGWRVDLPSRVVLDERILDSLPLFRLVPERMPGSNERWSLDLRGAQMQLVAAPVLFVHGWHWLPTITSGAGMDEFVPDFREGIREEARARLGQDPWAWAGSGGFHAFTYHPKQDMGETVHILSRELFALKSATGWQGAAPVDIVAHSAGGLAARLYTEKYGGNLAVRHLVTVNTPHLGSTLADRYTELLDRAPTGVGPNPFDPLKHWYREKDGDDLGHYYGTFQYFHKWGKWHKASVGAYRHYDRQDTVADFQIKKTDNRFLESLNKGPHPDHVQLYLVATHAPVEQLAEGVAQYVVPEVQGDGIVSSRSATWGYTSDHCRHVVKVKPSEIAKHGPSIFGLPFPHYQALWYPPIHQRTFGFLSGARDASVCDGAPDLGRALVDHVVHRVGPVPRCFTPCFGVLSENAVRANWTLEATGRALLDASAWNGSLADASVRLLGPDGSVATPDAPAPGQTWDLQRTALGLDRLLVLLDAPAQGEWILEVEPREGENVSLVATMHLDSTLAHEDRSDTQTTLGDAAVLRLALTDAGAPALSADVRAELLTDDGEAVIALTLRDDGAAPDEAAGDGVYAAAFTPDQADAHPYRLVARVAGVTRHAEGVVTVLATPDEAERGCARMDAFFADPAAALADPLEGPRYIECLDERIVRLVLDQSPERGALAVPVEPVATPERPLVHGRPEAHAPEPPRPPAPPTLPTPPNPPVPTPNPLACGLPPTPSGPIGFILVWVDNFAAWVNCVV